MCLAVPYKVISIDDTKAVADVFGVRKEIDIRVIENVNVDDYVLVHAGFAIQKMSQKEAKITLKLLREVSEKSI